MIVPRWVVFQIQNLSPSSGSQALRNFVVLIYIALIMNEKQHLFHTFAGLLLFVCVLDFASPFPFHSELVSSVTSAVTSLEMIPRSLSLIPSWVLYRTLPVNHLLSEHALLFQTQ